MRDTKKYLEMPLWKLNFICHYYRFLVVCKSARNKILDPLKFLLCYSLVISSPFRKANTLLSLYTWFRYVDNVVDGDLILKETTEDYIAQKQKLLSSDTELAKVSMRFEDILYIHAMRNSSNQELRLKKHMLMLFEAMLSEHKRRTTKQLVSEKQLNAEANELSQSIGHIIVMYLGTHKNPRYKGNGTGQWSDWFIDLMPDLKNGIVNIPSDVAQRAQLSFDDLSKICSWKEFLSHPELRVWFI